MTEELYTKIQERLSALKIRTVGDQTIGLLAYIDEDWGQLDLSDRSLPVNWPCCLFDVTSTDYEDAGQGRQEAKGQITVRIAHYNPVRVSSGAPNSDSEFDVVKIIEAVYKSLQGMSGETFTRLTRKKLIKVQRDDGIREFQMSFVYQLVDTSSVKRAQIVQAEIKIVT